MTTITTTAIYHFLFTQFWTNFKVRLHWPKMTTTTTTPATTKTTTTKTTAKPTATITTITTPFLGCDSIELNLVSLSFVCIVN